MLPVTASNTFVFTRSQRKQLFASLIEKALAKMHGSYKILESGIKFNFLFCRITINKESIWVHEYWSIVLQ